MGYVRVRMWMFFVLVRRSPLNGCLGSGLMSPRSGMRQGVTVEMTSNVRTVIVTCPDYWMTEVTASFRAGGPDGGLVVCCCGCGWIRGWTTLWE